MVYHGRIVARTGAELIRATKRFELQRESIGLPLLVMHGMADRLTDVNGSRQFYENCQSLDKSLKLYEGAYHEIFNDTNKEEFMRDLVEWLNAHC